MSRLPCRISGDNSAIKVLAWYMKKTALLSINVKRGRIGRGKNTFCRLFCRGDEAIVPGPHRLCMEGALAVHSHGQVHAGVNNTEQLEMASSIEWSNCGAVIAVQRDTDIWRPRFFH